MSEPPPLNPQVIRGLNDKLYEKRKAAALEVEKLVYGAFFKEKRQIENMMLPYPTHHQPPYYERQLDDCVWCITPAHTFILFPFPIRLVREAAGIGDHKRVSSILRALIDDFAYSVVPNSRNGGLISLAAAAIALGPAVTDHLEAIVPPILSCFSDQDSRVRYYACESMYNVAKVARGDILKYFNEIFDALSKLSADSELSVKNGAELLDRLMKDIVSERSTYYPQGPLSAPIVIPDSGAGASPPVASPPTRSATSAPTLGSPPKPDLPTYPPVPGTVPLAPGMKPDQFNLPRFIPLLSERIHTLAPFTRMFLVQWISVLDSVPDLELIGHLPDFLDGLFNYLSDPNVDVRVATLNVLGEFLKEIRDVVEIQRERGVLKIRGKDGSKEDVTEASSGDGKDALPGDAMDSGLPPPYVGSPRNIDEERDGALGSQLTPAQPNASDDDLADTAARLALGDGAEASSEDPRGSYPGGGSLPYVPGQGVVLDIGRMTEILGPHLMSTDEETQATALRWINEFISLARETMLPFTPMLLNAILPSLSHSVTDILSCVLFLSYDMLLPLITLLLVLDCVIPIRNIANETNLNLYKLILDLPINGPAITVSLSGDRLLSTSPVPADRSELLGGDVALESIDIPATVETLTLQFQDEHEETRVSALDWLLMLHRKAPKKVMSSDDSTFQALLRTLSDSSEEVVKRDLQLLAQISQASDDEYFTRFMVNLLSLFSTDRRLLETRGSLITRQLCISLNPERMYRTFAEILERDEDLDFASTMVQNLNIILITAPELADLRRRLRNLDARDGSHLFTCLYRSWSHNAVATFSLCLLAQAYEHAANLLQTFADLEITVTFLIQIDKLVQLIESPVFTYLRLQLLEPDRYPHLFKCLYGILMLLPQSSAFATLRNRLNSVSSMVMLYATAGGNVMGQGGNGVGQGMDQFKIAMNEAGGWDAAAR
ncbi:hypothetical protein HK104_002750 [Borealophlyctis nickersoniae]|nr:hypothetical protein HK104_002750 [Borealophlyctis nickersoniae]